MNNLGKYAAGIHVPLGMGLKQCVHKTKTKEKSLTVGPDDYSLMMLDRQLILTF